jgi:plastocyanin
MASRALALACAGAAGLVLALSLTGIAGGRTKVTVLRGTVGPGFTISLTKNGRKVTRLAPGMYRIVVSDRSAIHNFKLEKSGGGFERVATTVGFQGTRAFTVRLTRGRWEYYCVPHESSMKGHLVVGSGVAPATTNDD